MTSEEQKIKKQTYDRNYSLSDKELIKEKNKILQKRFHERNPEYMKEYLKARSKTPIGRAENLLRAYKQSDKKNNRGECTLTAKWIVENIFSKKCSYCEENDWNKLGCNRIDNKLPHTSENVEPCCFKCNAKLRGVDIVKEQSKKVYQYTLDGALVAVWNSLHEIERKLSFDSGNISKCCNGINKTSYGYKWCFDELSVK